jgi:molecular chaperone GrpE
VLQDFRAWLHEAIQRPQNMAAGADQPEFHWQTLVAEFTALRHEVNLQTRAARAQTEQNAEALKHLDEALAALQERPQGSAEPSDEGVRPLLKTLVDVYDALALARREVTRVQAVVAADLARLEPLPDAHDGSLRVDAPHSPPTRQRPWWHWWSSVVAGPDHSRALLRDKIADLENRLSQQHQTIMQLRQDRASRWQAGDQIRQVLNSVITGYTMGLQRIERALAQYDVKPIECVGEPFDPECMEVVEVVTELGRSSTEVLEEVRRGYLWHDRLFRHAQVRVARP